MTYLYTHNIAVSIPQPTVYRKSLLILFFSLISYVLLAQPQNGGHSGSGSTGQSFSLPLVLKTFNVSMNNKKVMLHWVTGHEKDINYFVIERSANGKDYTEVGVVFAKGNSTVVQNYSFPEAVGTGTKGVIYYRLRMTDSQKRYQYSPVRMIRFDDNNAAAVQVQAFPNPVVNELRITVPASWQNKSICYELYNTNGNLVKRVTNANAGQTETLSVADLGSGSYVVKTYTKDEVASQRIVKR